METPTWLADAQHLLWEQEEPLEALALLEAVLAELPSCVDGWNLRGGILCDLERYEEATYSFDQALKCEPDNYVAWYNRGVTLGNLERYEEAISSYDQVLKYQPDFHVSWHNRGNALDELKRYEEAISSFDQALKYQPDFHISWHGRGLALGNLERHEEAISSFDQALKHQPDFHQAWFNRGVALISLERYEEAIASFDQALYYKSDFYEAWGGRGDALVRLGRHEAAIISYDQALKYKQDSYNAWNNRGNTLVVLEEYEAAIASYDQALKYKPDQYSCWISRAATICNLSQNQLLPSNLLTAIQQPSLSAFQQPEPHIAALREALPCLIEGSLGWAHIHLHLGDAYLKHGKYKQNACPYWRDAVRSYQTALPIFTTEGVLEPRLEALQGLVRAHLFLDQPTAARFYQQQGRHLFEQLRSTQPDALKPAFEKKFASFSQREIDLLIGENNPAAALEQAEFYKNRCLTWILDAWQETVLSPSVAEMQTLCNPHTAILYWHLSPDALTTFLLTHNLPPQALASDRRQQAQKLEQWRQEYDRQYRDYAQKKEAGDRDAHPWRTTLEPQLAELRHILQIDALCEPLPATVHTLILLPHRDLHRFPLHALFPDRFTVSYLPSLQIGLNLRDRKTDNTYLPLLNVDDPKTEQEQMPFAQLESAIVRHLVQTATHIPPTDASLDSVVQALQEPYKTFHFTGHGAYNSRKPEESAIVLTDGLLTAKQIHQLDLSHYTLICLAACETAVTGKDDITTEYVGLATACLKAGAANVLSTLWQVDEISSAWLMIRFYQFLLAGDGPALALKQAQHWLRTIPRSELIDWITTLAAPETLGYRWRKELQVQVTSLQAQPGRIEPTDRPYTHPFHWAAYTLTGNPSL